MDKKFNSKIIKYDLNLYLKKNLINKHKKCSTSTLFKHKINKS